MSAKLVGKVREPHGLKGDLYILIFSGDISWAPSLKNFFLKNRQTGELMNYTAQRVKPFKKGLIVKASEVSDRNESELLKSCEFFIPEEILVSKKGETIFLSEIQGFMVKTPEHESLGPIVGFSSNVAQDLLVIEYAEKKVEIPFVEAFIKKIDFKNKYIVMDLPEGLLDIENL